MTEERPLLEHLPSEFLTWLWFASEDQNGTLDLGEELGRIDVWVDDRIVFRSHDDDRPRTVLTGENPSSTIEARAALAGGRVVRELRLGIRREDREYSVSLRGAELDLQGARLPGMVKGAIEEVLYDRMYLYEELSSIVSGLLRVFAKARTADDWSEGTLQRMQTWVSEALAAG